MKNKSYFWYSW